MADSTPPAGKNPWTSAINGLNSFTSSLIAATTKLATIEYSAEYEVIAHRTDVMLTQIDTMTQKMVEGAKIIADTYTNAVNVGINSVMQGVTEGAYAAADNLISASKNYKIFELNAQRLDLEQKNKIAVRNEQKNATLSNLKAEKDLALATVIARAGQQAVNIGAGFLPYGGDAAQAAAAAIADGVIAKQSADAAKIESENKLILQQYENEQKASEAKLKAVQEVQKIWIEAGEQVAKAWLKFAQDMEARLVKTDHAMNDLGISMGLTGQELLNFKHAMLETQTSVAKTWGKNMEDMMKTQDTYNEGTGRNVQFSTADFQRTYALDYLAGDGVSEQLSAGMEVFNHGISESNDMVYQMFKNVNKIGLNGRKYVKDLLKNLKLAERYEFKGGTKNLMKMSAWAQNVRFNMDSLDSILEKIQGSGLDGIIEQSARLQVLGGGFARGANPFSLMYDAYADPEDLAKTYNDMLEGVGVYNSKTGEAEFGIAEQIKMREFASITGQDYADVKNQRRQQLRGDVVSRQLSSGVDWSSDDKALVTNKAQLIDGQWKVTMDNGESVNVNQLTKEDLKHLRPENSDEREIKLVDDVAAIRSMLTQQLGVKEGAQARLESASYDHWYDQASQRNRNVYNEFNANFETKYLQPLLANMTLATTAQTSMFDLFNQGMPEIDNQQQEIVNQTTSIADTLTNDLLPKITQMGTTIQSMNDYLPRLGEIAASHSLSEIRSSAYGGDTNYVDSRYQSPNTPSTPRASNPAPASTPNNSRTSQARSAAAQGAYCDAVINSYCGRGSLSDGVVGSEGQPTTIVSSTITPIRDGMVAGDGNHMVIPAAKVTPISSTNTITNTQTTKIHDGAIAQADPQDVGVFAKVGGPFDTLFNGVFGRVNDIYDKLNDMGDIGNIITSVDTHNADMRRVGNDTQMLSRNIYNNLNRNIQSDWFDGHTETSQFTPQNIYNHSAHTNNNSAVNNGAVITSVDTHNADMRRVGNDIYNSLSELGTFNPQTGRVEYGIAEQVRLRDFAERTGQDIETVKQQIESRYNTSTDIVERIANQSTAINQILSNGNNDNVQPTHIEPSIPLGSTPTVFVTKPTQYNAGNPSQPQQSSSPSSTPSTQTVRLEINGKLELSSNGQQVDIINELRNNPTMVNALMQLIAQQTDRVSGGGRINLASGSSNYSF